jgi:uncharacterized membrane protein
MKTLLILFSGVTIFGCFLLIAGLAGSHGHFRFRPHMTEDWFIFGTPLLGFVGLILVTVTMIRNRKK